MPRPAARAWALGALALLTAVAGACSRLPGRRGGTPAPRDTAPVAVDTTRRDTTPAAAVRDSAARADSIRRADSVRTDSARADSIAGRPRRTSVDPSSRCGEVTFNEPQVYPTSRLQRLSDGQGKYITFFGGGVFARCVAVGSTLRADSAESYESLGQIILVGNVVYDEPRRARLTSMRLTYYTNEERLMAEGSVVMTMPSGTTMMGPSVEYLRAVTRVRPASRLTAIGRPTLQVVGGAARGTAAARAPDTSVTTIVANTIVNEADSVVYASGQVQIERTDVLSNSDSATFDQGTDVARLLRRATIRGTRDRPFTLSGARIDLYARERQLTRVVSRDSARIVSEDINLRSDTVDLRLTEGRLERAFAWGPSRAIATSPDRDVTADSIAAVLPGQRVRELWAVRRAVASSIPDTAKLVSKERDLLRGDTIHAQFDTLAAKRDTTKTPPVRRIRAAGHASSLYQVASSKGRTAPPAINYVRGRTITVDFDSGQVETVTVTDSAAGAYLEPVDSTRDSTRVDSIAVPTVVPARPGAPLPGRPAPGNPAPGSPATPTPAAPTRPAGTPPPAAAPFRHEPLEPSLDRR
ncbi:hypothetical protein [Roseisolibacter agri]|uniref:Organic solvent tolerance-like N-terminal domain-containing protein n=1 Tax=Roseisolibacter agri TaxID=2014610 RepID=A0AA37V7Y1_9BACT|nr:hypothetical protein [Roseisolibacter agri]GLC27221.1 hypothetical protein rosag_37340 [Roseisolibacter agri]